VWNSARSEDGIAGADAVDRVADMDFVFTNEDEKPFVLIVVSMPDGPIGFVGESLEDGERATGVAT
jgi:hypothetical protein